MAYVIGFAGKGGTGKTTIAAMTVRYLMEKKKKAVMAVDADSNACLNEALGLEIHATIGGLREDSLQAVRDGGERPGIGQHPGNRGHGAHGPGRPDRHHRRHTLPGGCFHGHVAEKQASRGDLRTLPVQT